MERGDGQMELKIVMADPAGNRTAIVRTPVPQELRAETGAKILGIRELRAEQAGFETSPIGAGAGRLEMMGGEFCGNATMCAAALFAIRSGLQGGAVPVKVWGVSAPFEVSSVGNGKGSDGNVKSFGATMSKNIKTPFLYYSSEPYNKHFSISTPMKYERAFAIVVSTIFFNKLFFK